MEVAYTIGHKISYDQLLREHSSVKKLGQRLNENPPYEGGWIWKTQAEAQVFIESYPLEFEAKIYGVQLQNSWETDVSQEKHADGVHRLLYDGLLFQLD